MKTKFLTVLTMIFLLFNLLLINNCYADGDGSEVTGYFSGSNFGTHTEIDNGMNQAEDASLSIIATSISVFRIIGSGVAIIILVVLGGKFMLGSVEQKAEIKKHLIPYVIGIFVFFSATTLLSIIHKFISGNF